MAKRNTITTVLPPSVSGPEILPASIGLPELLGREVILFCGIYIYAGRLSAIGDTALKLESAVIVYDTGPLLDPAWSDAQRLPGPHWWVSIAAIESFGAGKNT